MTTENFLTSLPALLRSGFSEVCSAVQSVERMHLHLNTLNSNEKGHFIVSVSQDALIQIIKKCGLVATAPDQLIQHWHIFLKHPRGGVFIQGPEETITL